MTYDRSRDTISGRDAGAVARNMALVTPNDGADLTTYPRALRVYNSGASAATVVATPAKAALDTDTVTLSFPPGVTVEPLAVRRVWATGTTAGLAIHGYQD